MLVVTRAAARTVAASLLAVPLLVLGAGVAWAAPGITLDPTGTLAAKAPVTVTATGFTPGTTVLVAECRPDGSGAVTSPQQCADAVTGSTAVAVADAQGSITARITVTVGDIRSGVSCTGTECVIGAISTVSTSTQALAPVTLTGAASTLPAASSTPTPTTSASTTATPEPTASESTATEAATSTPTPEETTASATPDGNSGAKPGTLPKTGADDAWRSLVVGLVALQIGLVVALRTRRGRAGLALGSGRHRH